MTFDLAVQAIPEPVSAWCRLILLRVKMQRYELYIEDCGRGRPITQIVELPESDDIRTVVRRTLEENKNYCCISAFLNSRLVFREEKPDQ